MLHAEPNQTKPKKEKKIENILNIYRECVYNKCIGVKIAKCGKN